MTLTPEQAKRLNEIGAICLGRKLTRPGWMQATDHERRSAGLPAASNIPCPDISLSDPPTDAQKLAIGALRKRAIEVDAELFATNLVSATAEEAIGGDDSADFVKMACASEKPIRNAALEVLCPDEHREELSRLLEGCGVSWIQLVGDWNAWYTKGWLTEQEVLDSFEDIDDLGGRKVYHSYGAKLQTAESRGENWNYEFRTNDQPGRGRFKVTVVDDGLFETHIVKELHPMPNGPQGKEAV